MLLTRASCRAALPVTSSADMTRQPDMASLFIRTRLPVRAVSGAHGSIASAHLLASIPVSRAARDRGGSLPMELGIKI
ncbi:uncharacterized protein UV8b_06250 [Ustilaginoidea virens]|uniref:Uncharacterized protein n=1 Tax=Ustilaginoidea virens TaxID=1159556 RepID=A0A8E5HUT8_USTVR|nr:uncharacterized protein UV8b_06250 [Ustilaginoidea virens]QUC22009.1 hypothetical protein UV8b_06250 [Ustilaginoidea virens]